MTTVHPAPTAHPPQSPRNFSGQSLRGRNFKGKDLSGADFSGADIRGANFTNAILRGANFRGAKAGLLKRWIVGQLVLILLLSVIIGVLLGYFGAWTAYYFAPAYYHRYTPFPGISVVTLFVLTVIAIACQGYTIRTARTIAISVAVAIAVASVVAFTVAGEDVDEIAVAGGGAGAVAVAVAVAAAFGVAVAVASTGAGIIEGISAGGGAVAVAVVVAVAVAGTVEVAVAIAVAVAVVICLLSLYVAWCVSNEDKKFAVARSIGVALGAIGGTSFRGADLTGADFTDTILKSTNFNASKQQPTLLTHTCWSNAQKLNRARVGDSILSNTAVRNLLVTGQGINQSYIEANLEGANLNHAKLNGANLKQAKMSDATCTRISHKLNSKRLKPSI